MPFEDTSCPIPMKEFAASTTEHRRTISLPPECFWDPVFYRFELDAVWGRDWFCAGRATDVPNPGDYCTITVGQEPLLIVRQEDGSIRVLANVCQHRGQLLLTGNGNVPQIRCPMHSWTYDLSGGLTFAPGFEEDPTLGAPDVCLPEIRSEVWEGFLFVTFDKTVAGIGKRLAKLKRQLANYHLSRLRSPAPLEFVRHDWNWKIFADECYHCTYLHARSFGSMFPVPPSAIDEECEYNDADNGIMAYTLIGRHLDASPTRTGKSLHPILPDLTETQRSRIAYITVAPNLLIVAMPDKVKYWIWLPAEPTASYLGVTNTFPEAVLGDPKFEERARMEAEDLHTTAEEDLEGWKRYQLGIGSRFAPRGRLSGFEKTLGRLQDWLVAHYRAAESG